jgi:hypothetical protein
MPYYEDQAPGHSIALVSPDGRSWATKRLRGEAYQEPAISPSGTYAAWLVGATGAYVEWSAATGFGRPERTSFRADAGDVTVVVDDAGVVGVIGGEPAGRRCVLGVHTRDLAGGRGHTTVPVDAGCGDSNVTNVDANTVLAGGYERATALTVSRTANGTWAVTAPPPAAGAGLVRYGYRNKRITTHFLYSTTSDSPVVAIGSPDRRRILAQVYDPATRSWSTPTTAYTSARRCSPVYDADLPLVPGTYAEKLRCGRRAVTLRSTDGVTWTANRSDGQGSRRARADS